MQKIIEQQIRARVSAELRAAFPQVFNLSRQQFAAAAGVTVGHVSNLEIKKQPMVKPVYQGKKPLYPVVDVADFLVEQRLRTVKRTAGRPPKSEKFAAIEGGVI